MKPMTLVAALALSAMSQLSSNAVFANGQLYRVLFSVTGSGESEVVDEGYVPGNAAVLPESGILERTFPRYVIEHETLGQDRMVEVTGATRQLVEAVISGRHAMPLAPAMKMADAGDEVMTLVNSGPSDNRIDLVFMGDGYTLAERDKFFNDMKRLTKEMFEGDTFHSQLPIFNVHAVFRASKESGIGTNDKPRDTAFGLAREGNTLRGINTTKPAAAHQACRAAPGCDYPILIANDSQYGGLGGEFSISTSSVISGTKVLRHELGHSVGEFGEEYDGGGYFGANHFSSLSALKWKQWLIGDVREEPTKASFIAWPWHNLSAGNYTASFKPTGDYASYKIDVSMTGRDSEADIDMTVDGTDVPFTLAPSADRVFEQIYKHEGLSKGTHNIVFKEGVKDGNNWVSSLQVDEYGADYDFNSEDISAYPLYQPTGGKDGYRPTHEGCVMRNMDWTKFCAVCQENNWLKFFGKVKVIDSVTSKLDGDRVLVTLGTPDLGQFRTIPIEGEMMKIRWFKGSVEQTALADKRTFDLAKADASGAWKVDVTFVTPEVRKDTDKRLHQLKTFTL